MNFFHRFYILALILLPFLGFAQPKLKLDSKSIVVGETLNYKATWGFLTIGSATTKVDMNLYKVGSSICYKIDIAGQTNGFAKLFYIRDKWISYIDTSKITTHKSARSIREGNYELDEEVHFNHNDKKAEVKVFDKNSKSYILKKIYDTPENIRDVVAGFVVFRLVDLSKYNKGDIFTINGFYEDEGYKINVLFQGKESIQTDNGKILCYKVRPIVPKNHVFEGKDAVNIWLSANKAKTIVRIRAKMVVGNILIDLQK
jgi:hypothetical protein